MPLGVNALPSDHVEALAAIEDSYWWFSGRVLWAEQLVKAALETSGKKGTALTYVDLGCGTGGFAKRLHDRFHFKKTILVDGDPKVLELASRHLPFEIHNTDLTGGSACAEMADIVTCMDVIEHLPNDEFFLKNLAQRMPQGTDLILSVPAYPAFYSEWDRMLGHYRRYTPHSLRRVLKNAGFSIQFLSPMWSFLAPLAPVRMVKAKIVPPKMEFQKVSSFTNATLTGLSRLEWEWAKRFSLPFGTSLITWVKKP